MSLEWNSSPFVRFPSFTATIDSICTRPGPMGRQLKVNLRRRERRMARGLQLPALQSLGNDGRGSAETDPGGEAGRAAGGG